MSKPLALLAVLGAATLALSACGGGGHGEIAEPPPDVVPASATESPGAFTRYVAMLPADDHREPLRVEGLMPPTSETAEPEPTSR